ncbi:acetyl-CoA acetyltransferase [Mycolicibacterium sp. BiH015]|uniref:acetyl-CoA acetyltransferase n=1 Tax=Mycolicibacterium sp. BiH015 TaxID=3018808 RepID=UPI0022E8F6A3|nr:acetyl-CoA acetyltransferase [Mycolicibacterium sp. BiH015]MDA2889430.1 acetyl-CoA acetyltransferase [Mycolicibacterium sp. BiH015]
MSIRGTAAIVGAAEVDTWQTQGRSPVGLMAEATRRAVADAGLTLADVDGLFSASSHYSFPTMNLAERLGMHPRYMDSSNIGGASFVSHVGHAAAAIGAGLCDVAVIAYGSTQRSDMGKLVSRAEWSAYEEPYGLIHPISSIALMAQRHMAEFGTTSEQLASVAVSARQWSLLHPNPPYPKPLTVEDVVESKIVSTPLHARDCCLVTDGGAAVVVVSAERAASLPHPPVYLRGFSESSNHRAVSAMPDLTSTVAAQTSKIALEMAGRSLADVDTAHVYDAFTASLLILLEDIGFCGKGEGGPFVADGNIAPGGSLALNTNGAGLSFTHPGMLGLFLLTEAVTQLRGDAGARQVEGAQTSLVHGMGLTIAAHSTAVLSTNAD